MLIEALSSKDEASVILDLSPACPSAPPHVIPTKKTRQRLMRLYSAKQSKLRSKNERTSS